MSASWTRRLKRRPQAPRSMISLHGQDSTTVFEYLVAYPCIKGFITLLPPLNRIKYVISFDYSARAIVNK